MQDDLQRMELEAGVVEHGGRRQESQETPSSISTYASPGQPPSYGVQAYHNDDRLAERFNNVSLDAPSFSPFPTVVGDNVPPGDDAKEEILWNARKHVLHSQNVSMQISWARDVLNWADISIEAATREASGRPRPQTPRAEHELRLDATNIVTYLAEQDHPEALYMRAKWLEFGKFGNRIDKREAYNGYNRAASLGSARAEYRIGMLYEQANDISKAKEHYYRGMSLKDSAALYRMGMMSLLGQHGEARDYTNGLERIHAAAESSDEDAPQGAYVYGMLVGRELPDITIPEGILTSSVETARMYIEKAAYQGFAKAQLKTGQAYELCQLGCDFNPSFSLHYYGLAAKQGIPEAALGVSRWFLFGYEGVFKKNEELAFKYAQEAASAKLPTGEFAIGYYYEIGIHVSKNIKEASRWYELAAEHGNSDAVGRLESLKHDKSLSKQDHETTTLTRIKSQYGSQRGNRPERFRQPQPLPVLKENAADPMPAASFSVNQASGGPSPMRSPMPSPGMTPTIVPEHVDYPGPSRASIVGQDRESVVSLRVDPSQQPARPQSAAPYPLDDGPAPLDVKRPSSTAPYPEDDVVRPLSNYHLDTRTSHGPHADRPMSAFGIRPQNGPSPGSQSLDNFGYNSGPAGGRIVSAGWEAQGPAYRNPMPGYPSGPGPRNDAAPQARPVSAAHYPNANGAPSKLQKQPPARQSYGAGMPPPAGSNPGANYSARTSSRPASDVPQPYGKQRLSSAPVASGGRPDRLSSVPPPVPRQSRVASGFGPGPSNSPRPGPGSGQGPGQNGPAQAGSGRPPRTDHSPGPAANAAATPSKPAKGPATFEDMGIPQGKHESDCVSDSDSMARLCCIREGH